MREFKNLSIYFQETLNSLPCDAPTKAYIISVYSSKHINDYSNLSLTLLFGQAYYERNFLIFQNIADWILFCSSLFPESLNNSSPEYYYELARRSYYSCYKLTNKKWKLYEELSDEFVPIVEHIKKLINDDINRSFG